MAKCSECGFLAARNVETRSLDETERAFRERGTPPVVGYYAGGGGARHVHERLPLCFVGSYDLRALFRQFAGKDDPDYASVAIIIEEERGCKEFTKWQQGFTPKEHREMILDEKHTREERRWRIINIILIVVLSGLFTLLGAFISSGGL